MVLLRNKKVVVIGNSYGIFIPKFLIDNKDLSLEKGYDIILKESKNGKN